VSIRSPYPLTDDQIRSVAPSIFATGAHESRSARYTYIPTSELLNGLRREGFQPFMVAQTRVRTDDRRDFAKHLIRLRHASQIDAGEANEIVMVNSHDGSCGYQMLAGLFRFVCANGMVCGDTAADIRVPHKGDIVREVTARAYDVLDGFTRVVDERDAMKATQLSEAHQVAFARAAIELKHDTTASPAPITERDVLVARRPEDVGHDLWRTLNRTQENLMRGGIPARTATGRRTTTRAVTGIDADVRLNRALWVLANELRRQAA
jgi:hypothetical protein